MADQRARSLRGNATLPERILWTALRKLKPRGFHFRRLFGAYIVDFVCLSAKIVVEVDGSQHGEPCAVRHDEARTAFLNSQGYRVLRFGNVNVMKNSKGVAEAVYAAARTRPTRLALCDNLLP